MFKKSYLSHVVFDFHIMSYLMMLQKSGFFVLSRRYRLSIVVLNDSQSTRCIQRCAVIGVALFIYSLHRMEQGTILLILFSWRDVVVRY